MSYLDAKFYGTAYGMGEMLEDGQAGQVVRLAGHNKFLLSNDPAKRSFGILYTDTKKDELCTVYTDGGIYETDNYTGDIKPGDLLKVDGKNKNLAAGVGTNDIAVGEAILVESGVLQFKLLV